MKSSDINAVLIGPPGTGKTTRLMGLIADELEAGTAPSRIGFVSYSRAACEEARSRAAEQLGLSRAALHNFRTLHSTCARLLGWDDCWIKPSHMKEFAATYGYRLSRDDRRHGSDDITGESAPTVEADDDLRAAYEWCRNTRRDPRAGVPSACPFRARRPALALYAERYERFKRDLDRYDYTDCLVSTLAQGLRPDVDVLLVDEAQDLSPLQAALVEQFSEGTLRSVVAGDDDQAIYGFQGADPTWLMGLVETATHRLILGQSWRLPRRVHRLADRIISQNRQRVAKTFDPRDDEGAVHVVRDIEAAVRSLSADEGALLLARTRRLTGPIAAELFRARVPYLLSRGVGRNPMGSPTKLRVLELAGELAAERGLMAEQLVEMVSMCTSRGADALLKHGAKSTLKQMKATKWVPTADMAALGLGGVLRTIESDDPAGLLQLKTDAPTREYFRGVLREHGQVPAPVIRVGTMHWSKGREADHVVVLSDVPRIVGQAMQSPHEREAENRVAYVAATRARQRLSIIRGGRMSIPFERYT